MKRALLLALLTGALAAPALAVAPARVGKDRPITREWKCENGRVLLLNFNPRRTREEAWLTYGGNRVEVHRARTASGVAYQSKDGKVKWHEKGDEGVVEYAGVIDQPVHCTLVRPVKKKK